MDLATLIKPILTTGQLRVVGSTTHEEYKHIEKDRALARRLQKITIDEPSIPETVRILQGLRSRYEAHHNVRFTDDALEAAAKLASRHLRDYRLPDSAIDVLDEAGARLRLTVRGVHGRHAGAGARRGSEPDRRNRRAHGANSCETGVIVRSRSPSDVGGNARPSGVRSGRSGEARVPRDQALARRARSARAPRWLLLVHGPDRCRQDGARQAARTPHGQRVHPVRHERVHGEARRRPADRRPARIRRVRAGRAAGGRRTNASVQRRPARRDREGASRHLQHPAAGDGPRDADRQQRPEGGFPAGRPHHDVQRRIARDERRHDRVQRRRDRARPRRQEACVAGAIARRDREGLQPGVPQSPRRDRQLPAAHARRDGNDRGQVHHPARGTARRTADRNHAPPRAEAAISRRRATIPSTAHGRSRA